MILFKLQRVGQFETGEFGQPIHEAVFEAIGKDYQNTHGNEKSKGVNYEYTNNDGSCKFRVMVELEDVVAGTDDLVLTDDEKATIQELRAGLAPSYKPSRKPRN